MTHHHDISLAPPREPAPAMAAAVHCPSRREVVTLAAGWAAALTAAGLQSLTGTGRSGGPSTPDVLDGGRP